MSRSRRLQLLALGVALAGFAVVASVTGTEVQASPPAAAAEKSAVSADAKRPRFPHHAEVEYERSVIRVPVRFGGEKKPREIVELTAFMKLEREPAVRNTIGYRQFEFTIREWELFGYSEALGGHLSFAASPDVIQPKSLCLALQKDKDFPALIVYNAIYDVYLDGTKILSKTPGIAMARGVMEIPPRNITVAFQKPFMIGKKGVAFQPKHDVCQSRPDSETCSCQQDPECVIVDPGSCEDMETVAAEEFESGLKEARAIRERLATLKPKPTNQQQPAGPGGQR